MNYCDHGHETIGEVRVLPLGGNGNMLVCQRHYHEELQARWHSNAWDKETDFPAWETLKIYKGEE